MCCFFFFQAEDGIRDGHVTGVQTCALPISSGTALPSCSLLLVLGHQVMDEHVQGDHPDLPLEAGQEVRVAGALPDRVFVPGAAAGAGDLVEGLAVALGCADRVTVLLAQVGMERPRPRLEITPGAVHGRTTAAAAAASSSMKASRPAPAAVRPTWSASAGRATSPA